MDNDERAARAWLAAAPNYDSKDHRATILRLLDRPVCPRGHDVPDDVLREMWIAWQLAGYDFNTSARAMIDTLHAHLTAPPPSKKVEAWAVVNEAGSCWTYSSKEGAEKIAHVYPEYRVIKLVEADNE